MDIKGYDKLDPDYEDPAIDAKVNSYISSLPKEDSDIEDRVNQYVSQSGIIPDFSQAGYGGSAEEIPTSAGPYKALGMGLLRGATANLADPVVASWSSLVAAPFVDRSIPGIYRDIRKKQKAEQAQLEEEYPGPSMVGELGGIVLPGGAVSGINKVIGKGLRGIAPGFKALSEIGGGLAPEVTASKFWPRIAAKLTTDVPAQALEGGLTNLAYQGIDPEQEMTPGGFGLGAAIGGVSVLPQTVASEAFQFFRPTANRIRNFLEETPWIGKTSKANRLEDEAGIMKKFEEDQAYKQQRHDLENQGIMNKFEQEEAARRAAYDANVAAQKTAYEESEAAREAAYDTAKVESKGLLGDIKVDPEIAGEALEESGKKANLALSKEYRDTVGPVLKQFGKEKISAKGLRAELHDFFKEKDFFDPKGNISFKKIKAIQAPEMRGLYENLAKFYKRIFKNPTLNELKSIEDELASFANFDSTTRSAEQKIYGKMHYAAKDEIFNGLDEVGGPEAVETVGMMRAKYREARPLLDKLNQFTSKGPTPMSRTTRTGLVPELFKGLMKVNPDLQEPLAMMVLNDLVTRGQTPKALSKAIDDYGRDNLQMLLGPEKFKDLTKAEEVFTAAHQPLGRTKAPVPEKFQRGEKPLLPSYVREAAPEFPPGPFYQGLEKFINYIKNRDLIKHGGQYLAPMIGSQQDNF